MSKLDGVERAVGVEQGCDCRCLGDPLVKLISKFGEQVNIRLRFADVSKDGGLIGCAAMEVETIARRM